MLGLCIATGDDPEADVKTDEGMAEEQLESVPSIVVNRNTKASTRVNAPDLICSSCGVKITEKVMSFSKSRYGRALCMDCQKHAAKSA